MLTQIKYYFNNKIFDGIIGFTLKTHNEVSIINILEN